MDTSRIITKNSEPFNIYSCSDDNYARHLGVLITSIKENMGPESIEYWIISNNISHNNKNKLKQIESDKLKINIIEFDKNIDYLSVTIRKYSNINLSAYMRLFVGEYIPKEISKILYLDADMICTASLNDLFKIPIEEHCVSGVRDIIAAQCCHRLGISHYINSGTFLINLDLWRQIDAQTCILEYISNNLNKPQQLLYHDQDALNCSLSGYIQYIDPKWNSLTGAGELEYKTVLLNQSKTGIILHLIGKPWIKGEWNQFSDEYARYLKLSPWSDEKVQITKKKGSPKWKLFCMGESLADKMADSKLFWRFSNIVYKQGYKQGLDTYLLKQFDVLSKHSVPSKEIIDNLTAIANTHNTLAMVRLARAYLFGYGVEKNYSMSAKIYCQCIELGDSWVKKELQCHSELLHKELAAQDPNSVSRISNALKN